MSGRDVTHLVLRVGTGFLFLLHGLQKVFGLFGGLGGAPVPLDSTFGAAGLIELVGGVLIVLGLFTRPVAVILAGEMVAAYTLAHLPRGLWPLQNDGELALLYALTFVFLAGHGAGGLSLDRWRRRRDAIDARRTNARGARAA